MNITLKVMERDEHGQVVQTGTKTFGPADDPASKWVKAPRKMWWGKSDKNVPNLSSAIIWKDGYQGHISGQVGYLVNDSNNVSENTSGVALQSWASSTKKGGVHVFPQNWRRCIALFAARKSIKSTWINQKDEYNAPDETHPDYDQWVDDCHVYSLFQSSSQQSSLRDIDYKDKAWNIENEFFWMSNAEMKDLADKHGFVEMYNDAVRFGKDRHMYTALQGLTLSPDAQEVLDMSCDLVRKSMPFRESAHHENPDLHLQAWDAGWYQVRKGILEPLFPKEYKAFVKKYKALEDRLREGVYDFGFLPR